MQYTYTVYFIAHIAHGTRRGDVLVAQTIFRFESDGYEYEKYKFVYSAESSHIIKVKLNLKKYKNLFFIQKIKASFFFAENNYIVHIGTYIYQKYIFFIYTIIFS